MDGLIIPKHRKKKMKKWKKTLLIVALSILGLLVAIAVTLVILINLGKGSLVSGDTNITAPVGVTVDYDIVTYKGHKYKYNKNMSSTVMMGIDKKNKDEYSGVIGQGGQADAVYLLALDTSTGKTTIFAVSRDTIVDVNMYDSLGQFTGTEKMQLCLAHTYGGSGDELSAENLNRSVSRIFYGIPIATYASLDMDAISVLNDSVGGIKLKSIETIKTPHTDIKEGETVTLLGKSAEDYVHWRDMVKTDANNYRMQRQKQYLTAFIQNVISKTKHNITYPLDLYSDADPYLVSNITPVKVSYFAYEFITHGFDYSQISTVPGEVKVDKTEKHAEFHVNEEEFYPMVLETYYDRID